MHLLHSGGVLTFPWKQEVWVPSSEGKALLLKTVIESSSQWGGGVGDGGGGKGKGEDRASIGFFSISL